MAFCQRNCIVRRVQTHVQSMSFFYELPGNILFSRNLTQESHITPNRIIIGDVCNVEIKSLKLTVSMNLIGIMILDDFLYNTYCKKNEKIRRLKSIV